MEKIVTLLFQKSEKGLEELAKQFGRRLYQTAFNIIGTHEGAEEAVSDTYMAVWSVIPPKQPDPLAPFVYKIGRNIALNQARHNAAQKRCGYDIPLSELEGCIAGPDLWEALDAKALGQAIDAFLDTLPRENRVIFLRRYWFGDSVKDIAKAFGISESAVSVRLSRTRDKLKAYLIEEGFYE